MRKRTPSSRWAGIFDALSFGNRKKAKGIRSSKRRSHSFEPLEERQLLSIVPPLVAPSGVLATDVSAAHVRYANGDAVLAADDLGAAIGTTRTYSSLTASQESDPGNVGYGWQLSALPYLAQDTGAGPVVVTFSSQQAYWFSVSGSTYMHLYGAKQTLTPDSGRHLLIFTDTAGTLYEFNDFNESARHKHC